MNDNRLDDRDMSQGAGDSFRIDRLLDYQSFVVCVLIHSSQSVLVSVDPSGCLVVAVLADSGFVVVADFAADVVAYVAGQA